MPTSTEDPLDGFRARTEEDDANEEMVRGIRGLAEAGIDYKSIGDIVQSNDLVRALGEDKTLAKLVDHAAKIIKENTYLWSLADNPRTTDGLHLQTRAARIVISWVQSIVQTGEVAEQLIEQQELSDE